MGAYRKKPVTIEARQFTGSNAAEIQVWAPALDTNALAWSYEHGAYLKMDGSPAHTSTGGMHPNCLIIMTLEGDMLASPGDWIIKGVQGEFYPCKPDIFEATYEPVA